MIDAAPRAWSVASMRIELLKVDLDMMDEVEREVKRWLSVMALEVGTTAFSVTKLAVVPCLEPQTLIQKLVWPSGTSAHFWLM